jgi:LysM repeat protein
MKRILILTVAVWLGGILIAPAQDASAAADRAAAEERYQRLAGKLQDLTEAQEAQSKRIAALAEEINSVREQQSKPNTDAVQRDELRKLAEQLKDVDEKRAADKELILKEISKLASLPVAPKPTKPATKPKSETASDTSADASPDKNYEGYEHTVKSGETLIAIVRAYNKEYSLKLTVDQVLKHPMNANVKPEKLAVGQKIFIPAK